MVHLREIPRTAVFAWSPGTGKPLLVTGTRAGAVDADFSDETKLELWSLNLDQGESGSQLQPIRSLSTNSRFYDIAWSTPDDDHPRGVIAGALENGTLELYDAEKLASGASDALLERTTRHNGAIKTLRFNPLKPQILATAGAKGDVFIYNIGDVESPFRLGNTTASRVDDIEALEWNKKVPHILAIGGSAGLVTVWDVKTKKASLTLNNNRKPISAIAWDPTNSTRLLTASPDDNAPVIYLWNLRNSNAPEKTLTGHEQGILSLSWCTQDSDIMLSCGKDSRTLVWNPQTGKLLGELQGGTSWAFLTRFNPLNPNLTATASFDGKISVQTIENTNTANDQAAAQSNLDGEDFFASAHTAPQTASFSLPTPPAWYLKPVGATFGFGGKVVYFTSGEKAPGQPTLSTVHVTHFSSDAELAPATEKFEEAMRSGDVLAICTAHIKNSRTDDEKADWEVLGTLLDKDPRRKVTERLGFRKTEGEAERIKENGSHDASLVEEKNEERDEGSEEKTDKKGLSSLFDDKDGKGDEDEDDFLNGLSAAKDDKLNDQDSLGPRDTFRLFGLNNTAVEDTITKEVMLGNFSKAVDICLEEKRIADAFVIANCGGKELLLKVQTAYLKGAQNAPSYLRLLSSVVNENLWDVAWHTDLTNWKEALATLCTFAKPEDFPRLCEGLGDRILEAGSRKDASFCFLVGSRLEKVVQIWISELEEAEKAGVRDRIGDSSFSVHTKSLQQFIEKVTVFRHVTDFKDSEISLTSGWKLTSLYDKYIEFANIIAETGLISIAQKYLDLVPQTYAGAGTARSRVHSALRGKPTAQQPRTAAAVGQTNMGASTATRTSLAHSNYLPPTMGLQQRDTANSSPANPYAPPVTSAVPTNLYHSAVPTSTGNPYAPTSSYTPAYGQSQQPPPFAPPTASYGNPLVPAYRSQQNSAAVVAPPPPPQARDIGSWNDVPLVTRPPVRRSTPNVAPITAPFGAQQIPTGPPSSSSFDPTSQPGVPTLPPPPKNSAPLRMTSPPTGPVAGHAPPKSDTSSITNPYAPPQAPAVVSNGSFQSGARPPQTQSPSNTMPHRPPSTSRYAPAPTNQQTPIPGAQSRYALSPYESGGVQQHMGQSQSQQPTVLPPPPMGAPPMGAPPMGPPPMGPPPGGPVRTGSTAATLPTSSQTPVNSEATVPPVSHKVRYPPGDRSHIPPQAQRLVQILTADLQRVAAKAPPAFAAQVKDTNKRLNLLFDHLNNSELIQDETVRQLVEIAEAVDAKAYDQAQRLQVEIHRNKPEECGNWMVGVKRLIAMSKATP